MKAWLGVGYRLTRYSQRTLGLLVERPPDTSLRRIGDHFQHTPGSSASAEPDWLCGRILKGRWAELRKGNRGRGWSRLRGV
jgi:hypothetical protein